MKLTLYKSILYLMGASILILVNKQTPDLMAVAAFMGFCVLCGILFTIGAIIARNIDKQDDEEKI